MSCFRLCVSEQAEVYLGQAFRWHRRGTLAAGTCSWQACVGVRCRWRGPPAPSAKPAGLQVLLRPAEDEPGQRHPAAGTRHARHTPDPALAYLILAVTGGRVLSVLQMRKLRHEAVGTLFRSQCMESRNPKPSSLTSSRSPKDRAGRSSSWAGPGTPGSPREPPGAPRTHTHAQRARPGPAHLPLSMVLTRGPRLLICGSPRGQTDGP